MKKEKQKIIFIHGGETFKNYDIYIEWLKNKEFNIEREFSKTKKWSENIKPLLEKKFDYFALNMPNKFNAKYEEWKIWFEKAKNTLCDNDNCIFVGYSLGATFLVKYFSEEFEKVEKNNFEKLFLVSTAIEKEGDGYDLDTFDIDLKLVQKMDSEKIFIYHSKDDFVVDFRDFEILSEKLQKANKIIFEDRNHFLQEEFDELVEDIKTD